MRFKFVRTLVVATFFYIVSAVFLVVGYTQPNDCDKFGLSDCFKELNKWDYLGGGFLVFAIAATIASIQIRNLED